MQVIEISNGLKLFKREEYIKNQKKLYVSGSYNDLIMHFNLKGKVLHTNFLNNDISQSYERYTKINLLNKFDGLLDIPHNTHREVVLLMLEKSFLLKVLPNQKKSDDILNFFETKKISQNLYNDQMKLKTQTLAYDILNSPYTNKLDKLYIESKVLELIHNELATLLSQKDENTTIKFSKQDKEAIYHAREILLNSLSNPPSMKELAKIVAINDLKLKMGFRKFFNQTPYSISLEYRLQEAKKLLQTSEMNINEIAEHIGYKHATNFSNIFYKKFGIRPKELMKSRKYYY